MVKYDPLFNSNSYEIDILFTKPVLKKEQMFDPDKIIEGCKRNNPIAIKALYNKYASKLFGICTRYARTNFEAEDILQEGFIKIIKNFNSFSGNSKNLEAWLRKIILFTAIDQFKQNLPLKQQMNLEDLNEDNLTLLPNAIESDLDSEDLVAIINMLPEGYKMVFNLYVVEGFTHIEIAEMLNISEGTSKSQLSKARKFLQNILGKYQLIEKGVKYGQ